MTLILLHKLKNNKHLYASITYSEL